MAEQNKKAALRCRVKTCGRTFISTYGDARPYGEFWEHAKNMHGPILVEEIVLSPEEIESKETTEISF